MSSYLDEDDSDEDTKIPSGEVQVFTEEEVELAKEKAAMSKAAGDAF